MYNFLVKSLLMVAAVAVIFGVASAGGYYLGVRGAMGSLFVFGSFLIMSWVSSLPRFKLPQKIVILLQNRAKKAASPALKARNAYTYQGVGKLCVHPRRKWGGTV